MVVISDSDQSVSAPKTDQDRLVDKINRQMGSLIHPLLKDKDLVEILANPDGTIWEGVVE